MIGFRCCDRLCRKSARYNWMLKFRYLDMFWLCRGSNFINVLNFVGNVVECFEGVCVEAFVSTMLEMCTLRT